MRKNIVILLTIALLAAVVGPGIINRMYQASTPWIYTVWGAADVLSYYGTIISAVISVLILALTICHERENIVKERKYSDIQAVLSRAEESFQYLIKSYLDEIQDISTSVSIFEKRRSCIERNASLPDLNDFNNVVNELRQCNMDVERLLEILTSLQDRSVELLTLRVDGMLLKGAMGKPGYFEQAKNYTTKCRKFVAEIHSIDRDCRCEFLKLRRIAANM